MLVSCATTCLVKCLLFSFVTLEVMLRLCVLYIDRISDDHLIPIFF